LDQREAGSLPVGLWLGWLITDFFSFLHIWRVQYTCKRIAESRSQSRTIIDVYFAGKSNANHNTSCLLRHSLLEISFCKLLSICVLVARKPAVERLRVSSAGGLNLAKSPRFSPISEGPSSTSLHLGIPVKVVDVRPS
jgi:hypothetical protein